MHIYREQLPNGDVWAMMKERQADIDKVYNLLADDKSKQLFVSKMALIGSDKSFHLFKEFILNHSEPYQEFGAFNYDGTPEDYYYFNNNVITLDDGEVFLDVGAFDGDTIEMFVDTCNKASISYKHIYAVEPDPPCYEALKVNTSKYENVTYHQIGFGQEEMDVSFMASDVEEHFNVGIQSETGNISIHIVRMDDFIFNEDPTFIKMDPGQNVIPDILAGAKETITSYKPKLALGAYHSCMALFEIPLHVHNLCPEYKIYLRHGTYHLADTDMFAHI
jgi:FkbM family methyltransferase